MTAASTPRSAGSVPKRRTAVANPPSPVHPGRQPQERRRPEAAPLDTSAIVHTLSHPNPGPGASPDAVRERYSSAVNLPGRGREKRGAGQMPGRERETVSRSRRRGRQPERRLDNV